MAFLFLANSTGKAVSFDTPEPFGPRKRVQSAPGAGDGRIDSASCSNQVCRTRHFMCGQYSNHATRTALPLARTPSAAYCLRAVLWNSLCGPETEMGEVYVKMIGRGSGH